MQLKEVIIQAIWPTFIEFKTENGELANFLWEDEDLYLIAN